MGFVPELLLECLRAACPTFARERLSDQLGLARLLLLCAEPRRAHSFWEGFAFITKSDLRNCFKGGDARARSLLRGKHFIVYQGDYWGRHAAAYQPSESLLNGLDTYLRSGRAGVLLGGDGRPVARQLGAIDPFKARSRTGSTWTGCAPQKLVPVDVTALEAIQPSAPKAYRRQLGLLIAEARSDGGFVRMRYRESRSGRLFETRVLLQGLPRELRAVALNGCWDYDIENCHYAVLEQLATALGLDCPQVRDYLRNKRLWREQIAAEVGIDLKAAKQCLIMVVYGAARSITMPDPLNFGETLPLSFPKVIGVHAAERLFEHPRFAALHEEVNKLRGPVIAHHTKSGMVVNAMGVALHFKTHTPAQRLAHVLQGYEAAALRAVVRLYGERILVCLHDGWIAREQLDVEACQAAITAATGLRLCIEQVQLAVPEIHGPLLKVSDEEFLLCDEQLTAPQPVELANRTSLRSCSHEELQQRRRGGSWLSLRADWNYPTDDGPAVTSVREPLLT